MPVTPPKCKFNCGFPHWGTVCPNLGKSIRVMKVPVPVPKALPAPAPKKAKKK